MNKEVTVKRFKWVVATLLLAMVPVFTWVGLAQAQRFSNRVDDGQVVNSSLYSAGKTIEIKGQINGDVFCAGQNVRIEADVRGDVICAAQDITIGGTVTGDVRIAAQLATIKGQVAGSATVAALSFSLDAGYSIGRDLTVTGDTANIKGRVARDVLANGNSVTFNGQVGRDVRSDAAKIRLKSDARIAGNLTYTSDNKLEKDRGAVVSGSEKRHTPKQESKGGPSFSFSLGLYLFMLSGLLVICLVLAYLFPRFFRRTSDQIRASFLKSFLVGLAASFLVPMLSLGLIVSIVGMPLVLFVLLAWLFASALTTPIVAFYVGRLVFRNRPKGAVLTMLVGTAILVTAYFFPFTGVFFFMLAYWTGLGALLLVLKDHARTDDEQPDETVLANEPLKAVAPAPAKPKKKAVKRKPKKAETEE